MKKIILSLFLLSSYNSYAGDSKGHGGDILQCEDTTYTFHNTSLDYYELIHKYNKFARYEGQDEIEIAKHIIKRLEDLDFHRYKEFMQYLQTFYQDVKWSNFPLTNVRDSGVTNIPSTCKLKQIINQNKKLLRGSKKYIINKKLWSQLDILNRATLIVHELLYLNATPSDSQEIRKLNALLFADEISSISKNEYWEFLKRNKFTTFSYAGVNLQVNTYNTFHQPHLIKSALPVKGSQLQVLSQNFTLAHNRVFFHQDGTLKSFCSGTRFYFQVHNNELIGHCEDRIDMNIPVSLYPDGKLKSTAVSNQTFGNNNYSIQAGTGNHRIETSSKLTFSKDQEITEVTYPILTLKRYRPRLVFNDLEKLNISNNQIKTHLNRKYFHESLNIWFYKDTIIKNGKIVQTYLAKEANFYIGSNNVYLLENAIIDFYEDGNIKSITPMHDTRIFIADGRVIFVDKNTRIDFNKNGEIL